MTAAGSVAVGTTCTAVADCAGTGSCCGTFSLTTGGAAVGTGKVCWAAGTAVTVGVLAVKTANTATCTTATGCFPVAACAAAAGASTLAVSAAALATAVYVM